MNEAEFAAHFGEYLEARAESILFPEVLTSSGMPDLMVVAASHEQMDSTPLPPEVASKLTNGRAAVAAALSPRRGHRLDYLSRVTGRDSEHVRRAVAELVGIGLAIRDEDGLVRLGPRWPEHLPDLEVFELKMADWKKALAQSLRYRRLAKRVTVVMPQGSDLHTERIIGFYSQYGVGLAQFDPATPRLTYVVRPRAIGPTSRVDYLDAVGRLAGRVSAHAPSV